MSLKPAPTLSNNNSQVFENQIDRPDLEEFRTTEEAAAYLKISAATLRNETSNGKIPYYKFGRRNRYLRSELKQLLEARGVRYDKI